MKRILCICLVVLFVCSCKKDTKSSEIVAPEITSKTLNLVVDNSFSYSQKSVIKQTFDKYDNMVFSSNNARYRKFFGGDGREVLDNFINKRVKYFVSVGEEDLRQSFGDLTKAVGAGYVLSWLASLCNPGEVEYYAVCNGAKVDIDTPRHGVMISGPAFFYSDTTDIERISVLAHEARHADCRAKPSQSVACSLLVSPDILDLEEMRCGHIHAKCSEKDTARACEKITWGSYAVSYIVLSKIYEDCLNCSEEDKQTAAILAKGYGERFMNNPFEGTPDLSSYDE